MSASNLRELFNGEDPINVKPDMLFSLMREAAKSDFVLRAIRCGTPHAFIIGTFDDKEKLGEYYNAQEVLSAHIDKELQELESGVVLESRGVAENTNVSK